MISRSLIRQNPGFQRFVRISVLALFPLLQGAFAQTAQAAERLNSAAAFEALRVGQRVGVVEKAGGLLELQLINDGKIGTYVVKEIHPSHVVLEDIVSVSKRWIPLTSIQSIVWTRVPDAVRPPVPTPLGR